MRLFHFRILFLLPSIFLFSQPIPFNHISYSTKKLLFDSGKNWESLTSFGPVRYKFENNNYNDKSPFNAKGQIGISNQDDSFSIYGNSSFTYNNYYYGYIYPKFTNETIRYNLNKLRSGLNNIRETCSGVGFENSWAILQIGSGIESWGSGNDIQLALSENSSSYDYFLLASDYGKIRVKYIHGFLESVEQNINRYITARGVEYTNRKTLVIGFSETIIYSGEDRFLDFSYINPISSHLEVELNDRLNMPGSDNSNAVWQIHLDYLISQQIRISGNFLYDEFVFDPQIELDKEHGKAHSIRIAYTPISSDEHLFTIYGTKIYVGTPTFRHGKGTNNFVQKGIPLGWNNGSDSQEISFGFNYFNQKNIITSISTGILQSGEESITNRVFEPYADYIKGVFPSGERDEFIYIHTYLRFWWGKNFLFSTGVEWSQNNENNKKLDLRFNLDIFYPFSYFL